MSGADERLVTIHGLKEGRYVFQLTVTDDRGLTDSDTVAVNVKKGERIPHACVLICDVTSGRSCLCSALRVEPFHCLVSLSTINIKFAKSLILFSNNVNTTIRKYSSRAFI